MGLGVGEEKRLQDGGLGGRRKTLLAGSGAVWLPQLLCSPGLLLSVRCQVPSSVESLEQRCFPLLKGQPQIIRCLKPPNSPHLFLLLWAGFLSQRRERLPPCSPAVNGLSRGPGTIARVCCPPWEQLFLGPTKIPPAARAEPPAGTAVLASSPLPGCLLPPEPGAGTEEGQRVWGESNL